MKNYTIQKYSVQDASQWNEFISCSKNATFLHNRNFMDYHSERFEDFSLVVLDDDKWVAVLPANVSNNEIHSHQGLTYGGLLYDDKLKLESIIEVFQAILQFLNENKIEKLYLKSIPSFYFKKPADELNYALFLTNAKIIRSDCLSIIDLTKDFFVSKTRKESIRRGVKNNLIIKEEFVFDNFWNEILIPNLDKKHNAKPVHSLDEIKKLHQLFPDNIRQFNVYYQDKIVAGSTVFVFDEVAHPQYVSGQKDKNELGCLDFLYDYLIKEIFKDKKVFDFGPSHEQNGKKINKGILFWKESFGVSTVSQNHYEIETKNFNLLDNILI